MNFEDIHLTRPVKIIQAYRHIHIYGKENKSALNRKDGNTWQPISSTSGYFLKEILYLPKSSFSNRNNFEFIQLVDSSNKSSHTLNGKENINFFNLSRPKRWDIFDLHSIDVLELHLRYDHFDIGEPFRDNFKLCDLKLGQPVEIQINGKLDFSLTSRRARTYKEQFYILEYLGEVDHIRLVKSPMPPFIKHIPHNRKVINLLKPLW